MAGSLFLTIPFFEAYSPQESGWAVFRGEQCTALYSNLNDMESEIPSLVQAIPEYWSKRIPDTIKSAYEVYVTQM